MKKVLTVVVCLLLVGSAFALESGPSNKVGYVKLTCLGGATAVNTPFGLPFTFWNVPDGLVPTYGDTTRLPSMIIGTQAKCSTLNRADEIVRQGGGGTAFRLKTACNWTGSLQTSGTGLMDAGYAYWYRNRSGASRDIVLAGEADITAASVPTITCNAPAVAGGKLSTPYSWKDPRTVARDDLNLLEDGFTGGNVPNASDQIIRQGGGGYFWYSTSLTNWQGTLTGVDPGAAFWIANRHVGHPFNYTYRANGNPIMAPGGDSKMPTVRTVDGVKAVRVPEATKVTSTSTKK